MADLFYVDKISEQTVSYQDLLNDIRTLSHYNKYCKSNDYYIVFRSIIFSLLLDKEIVLLDEDLSLEEIENQIGQKEFDTNISLSEIELLNEITTIDELFQRCTGNPTNWRITLFTSGTTGLPKMIKHDFSSISRSVKKSVKHADAIWGFAFNPTHMAGIQVFFQAFLNRNIIIRLFRLEREDILKQIRDFQITRLSATPTFYRLLLPADVICPSVLSLTSGGERFDRKTIESLGLMFPNAKITNVYASTEAGAVFASNGEFFSIKPSFFDFVKIENNELYLHKSIMGDSDSLQLNNNWYATGDIVDVICEIPLQFSFVNRKNEMINVGGYKVNPAEVEDVIRSIPGIKEVRVYGKKNSLLGNLICAEVVRTDNIITEPEIRIMLQNRLQEFKIPRFIKFMDNIEITRTGKIKRN